ncbi:hypothetical protein SNK03_009167 [Fusarium graminearum]|uniref:Chromosome 4, complete genome n=2 Tax=Gibberella zeae TaxID=5518 RepID=A0A0E0SAV4_GIBZE|nr:hypothetical protein FG05_30184 [Fusarium graminearum]KAI6755625.1 hypothetical protein HG531_004731 [Fusarium graminearum]CAF3451001.1 unnamed protein product [Fusarium graminearum]CAF3526809.1 unnamed protein product [Fusarium graminearum]CAF3574094.1 unnamed protein product [Fusarium graminearum]
MAHQKSVQGFDPEFSRDLILRQLRQVEAKLTKKVDEINRRKKYHQVEIAGKNAKIKELMEKVELLSSENEALKAKVREINLKQAGNKEVVMLD